MELLGRLDRMPARSSGHLRLGRGSWRTVWLDIWPRGAIPLQQLDYWVRQELSPKLCAEYGIGLGQVVHDRAK